MDAASSSTTGLVPWWKESVVYQIYPRSFADGNGDGIGDLPGILTRIDYLHHTLGIDAIWLSPFYPSPQADFGYDISDYTDVDPVYGTLEDFDALLAACHDRGMHVIIDFVPNHTSDQHEWFLESRSSRDNPKRDWYVWRDPAEDGGPPNNWVSVFGGPAWEFDERTGQYYLHSFLEEQPDLDWRNPEVRAAMHGVLRFWLDRGVDGFRIDVANFIGKDPELRDNPPAPVAASKWFKDQGDYDRHLHIHDKGHPDTHGFFREIRSVLDEYEDRYSVGEIHEPDWNLWASYYGSGDELHQVFDFSLLHCTWDVATVRALIEAQEAAIPPFAWPNHVFGNHDEPRLTFRRGASAARLAAVLLLTTRGTPTLYYGDEIGLDQAIIPDDRQLDPWAAGAPGLGRDGCRTPMQWSDAPYAGFTPIDGEAPWLPVNDDYKTVNVEAELADPNSMLNLYRRLLALRKTSPALRLGSYETIPGLPGDVYGYTRSHGDEHVTVLLNFGGDAVTLSGFHGEVTAATNVTRDGERIEGDLLLGGTESVVLRTQASLGR